MCNGPRDVVHPRSFHLPPPVNPKFLSIFQITVIKLIRVPFSASILKPSENKNNIDYKRKFYSLIRVGSNMYYLGMWILGICELISVPCSAFPGNILTANNMVTTLFDMFLKCTCNSFWISKRTPKD